MEISLTGWRRSSSAIWHPMNVTVRLLQKTTAERE